MATLRELTPDQEIQMSYLWRKIDEVRETLEDQLLDTPLRDEAITALHTVGRLAYLATTTPEIVIEPLNHPDIRQDSHA